jgi:hypothetical protein
MATTATRRTSAAAAMTTLVPTPMRSRSANIGRRPLLVPAAACLLVLAGCSTGEDDASDEAESTTPAATSEAEPAQEERDEITLTVTWDGDTCAYGGPTELTPGVVLIEIVNDTDDDAGTEMVRIDDGSTFEDFVEALQPEPDLGDVPDFVSQGYGQTFASAGDVGTIRSVLDEGEYALVCLQTPPDTSELGAWVAQPGGVVVTG